MLTENVFKMSTRRVRALVGLCLLAAGGLLAIATPAQAASPLAVDVTATPSALRAPGGMVAFAVSVVNSGVDDLTVTAISDSVYGNLNGQGTCAVGAVITASGGTYNCSFNATVTGVANASQVNTVTVKAKNGVPVEFAGSDTTVVVITPRLGVGNTANPATLSPPGGTVTFNISAINLGADSITITAISDNVYGDLSTKGTCTNAVGTVLASEGTNYTCSYTANVTGTAGQVKTNTATITASGTGGPFTGSDPATVTFTKPEAATTAPTTIKTTTTTTVFAGSTAGLTTSLSQSSGVPDERFTVSGTGWAPSEVLTVTFNSATKVLGTTVADATGRFSLNVKVPDDATVGAHTVVVAGQVGRAISKPFTVTAGSAAAITTTTVAGRPTATTIAGRTLVRTGSASSDLAGVAMMALLLGGAAVAASPRGRRAWSARSSRRS